MKLRIPSNNTFGPFGDTTGFLIVKVEGLVDSTKVSPPIADFFLLKDGNTFVVVDLDLLSPSDVVQFDNSLNLLSAQIKSMPIVYGRKYVYKTYTSTTSIPITFHSQNLGITKVSATYSTIITNKIRIIFHDNFNNPIADKVLEHNREYILRVESDNIRFSTKWINTTTTSEYTLHILTMEV